MFPTNFKRPGRKSMKPWKWKKDTINSSQRCSGRYTGIVTISINQPHVGIYKSYSNIPVPMDPMERFTKKHANSFFFHQNSSDFPVKPPPPASNAPSRQGPVPPSQWTVKFLWGSPHEIRFTKRQRGVSEILERRNHLCGVQPTSWRKLVGWFTVSLFFILKNDASLEDDRQRALTETNPPALPACLVKWGLMTDCLSVLCFCLYSLS